MVRHLKRLRPPFYTTWPQFIYSCLATIFVKKLENLVKYHFSNPFHKKKKNKQTNKQKKTLLSQQFIRSPQTPQVQTAHTYQNKSWVSSAGSRGCDFCTLGPKFSRFFKLNYCKVYNILIILTWNGTHLKDWLYCVSQKEVDTNLEAYFIKKNKNVLKLPFSTTNKCSLDIHCDKYQSN